MTKPKLKIYRKTEIIRKEDALHGFEWYFVDVKQLNARIEWLLLNLKYNTMTNKRKLNYRNSKIPIHHIIKVLNEAFEEVIKNKV